MAIKGVAAVRRSRGNHIVTTTVEHPSVITPCVYLEHQGFQVSTLDVDSEGMLDLNALEAALGDKHHSHLSHVRQQRDRHALSGQGNRRTGRQERRLLPLRRGPSSR